MSAQAEIIIQPDGTILIPRGTKQENSLIRDLVSDMQGPSQDAIEAFLSVTDNSELLFGETTHCG